MTPSAEILFHHVSEKSFYPYLNIPEYDQYTQIEEKVEESIRQLLPPGHAGLLNKLSEARNYCSSIEQEAAFQAGLAIGLELSRL